MFVSRRERGSITVSFVSAVDPCRAQQRQDHPANQPADRMLAPSCRPFPAGRSHPLAERSPLPRSSVEIASAAGPPDCFRNEKPAPCPCNHLQQCIYSEYTRSSFRLQWHGGGSRRLCLFYPSLLLSDQALYEPWPFFLVGLDPLRAAASPRLGFGWSSLCNQVAQTWGSARAQTTKAILSLCTPGAQIR